MNEVEEILNNYYNNYDEDSRLTRDKAHFVEYLTTTKYIEKYLKEGDKILEVGAGTGKYSIYYASKGYCVDAIELVNELNEEDFTIFMDYHLKNCNRKDLIGYSSHIVEIVEKR